MLQYGPIEMERDLDDAQMQIRSGYREVERETYHNFETILYENKLIEGSTL